MKRLFAYQLPHRKRIVTLRIPAGDTHPFHKFTFLEMDLSKVKHRIQQTKLGQMQSFKQLLYLLRQREVYDCIQKTQNKDFSEKDLLEVYQQLPSQHGLGASRILFQKNKGESDGRHSSFSRNHDQNKETFQDNRTATSSESLILTNFSQAYMLAKQEFQAKMEQDSIYDSILHISDMNFIQLQVNQKMFSMICLQYKHSALNSRKMMINYLTSYRKKFRYNDYTQLGKIAGYHYKMVLHGSHQRDLIDYNHLVRSIDHEDDYRLQGGHTKQSKIMDFSQQRGTDQSTSRFISQKNFSNEQILSKLRWIMTKLDLIFRWSKVMDINIFWIRQQLSGTRSHDIIRSFSMKDVDIGTFKTLLNLYIFFSFANVDVPYQRLENALFVHMQSHFESEEEQGKHQLVYKLLTVWKNRGKFPDRLFEQFVYPILSNSIRDKTVIKYASVNFLAYNLICSFQGDVNDRLRRMAQELTVGLVELAEFMNVQETISMHLVKHYLTLKLGWTTSQTTSNDPYFVSISACKERQDKKLVEFLHKHFPSKINACLQHTHSKPDFLSQSGQNKDDQSELFEEQVPKNYGDHRTKKALEYNDVENFWQTAVAKVVPANSIINRCQFCSYEIDTLVLHNGRMIAIEIEGSHYNANLGQDSVDSLGKNAQTGKKMIRQSILLHYGVEFLKIKCWMKEEHQIMRSNSVQQAERYIKKRIQELFGEPV